jgi:RHS repeat-associated protein
LFFGVTCIHIARRKSRGIRWPGGSSPTDLTFTGQRTEGGYGINGSAGSLGSLMDYNARTDSYIESGGGRMYSPILGRFLSPDSIVPHPGDPQSLNRYSYTRNNPTSRNDPDGHADGKPGDKPLCQVMPMLCQPEGMLMPKEVGNALNVDTGSFETVMMPNGTVMAKGAGKGVAQKIKDGVSGFVGNVCKGFLALVCAKATKDAVDAVSADGDPTNEVNAVVKAGDFGLKKIIEEASGMSTAQAGKYFGWLPEKVTKVASEFTKSDLVAKGFTRDVLIKMAQAYEQIASVVSNKGNTNPSAPGRAEQLYEIVKQVFDK